MIEKQALTGNQERAILVGVCTREMTFSQAKEYLDELAFLAKTAGARTIRSFIQRLDRPHVATYIGKGKVEEIQAAIEADEISLVIFDDDLSPSQIRNLDKALGVKVLDRSSLILHIFSERAQTSQARIQVDLAQYQYLLPRLAGMWTHLSRQKGGIGLKGAGEKEIETDRRVIRQRIAKLQKELEKIDLQSANRRKNRDRFVRVALVGYTNVGKSTLMNVLSKSQVLAENKLFATLDTTVRKVSLEGVPFLLSDTVGFIRKLPHHLVECFKGTLAESLESDLLVHVVDVSHPHFEDQMKVVQQTLHELGASDKPVLTVFNKVDALEPDHQYLADPEGFARRFSPSVCISAMEKINLDQLRHTLARLVYEAYQEKYPEGAKGVLNGEFFPFWQYEAEALAQPQKENNP